MFTQRLERVKYKNLLLLIAFYLILIACFAWVVKDEYAFKKVELVYELDYLKLTIGLFCVFFNVVILSILKIKDFLYAVASLLLTFLLFPSAILFSYVQGIDSRIFLAHNLFFLSVLMISKIKIKLKSRSIEIFQSRRLLLFIVVIGMIPFIILFLPYLNFRNLLLIDIYETRELMDTSISNLYTGYTYSWFNKFIIPCLLVFGIYLKDRFTIFVCSISLVFLFLCGAHKAVFVGLIVTFVLYKYDYLTKINYLLKLLLLVAVFSLVMALIFRVDFFMTMSIRRAVLLPAMVDVLYFDLFNNNHLYWSETFNGLFKTYPYNHEHSYIIGEKYFQDIKWGANNGIISDGFMNFGVIGVCINIFVVAIYISVLNQLDISPRFFGLFLLFVFLIFSSALTTIMLTHGGIILILLALFFMRDTNKQMA